MNKSHFLLFLPMMFLLACQKEDVSQLPPEYLGDHTIMQGRVTDPWGMPIAGAEVSCKVLAGIPYRDEYTFWIPGDTTDADGYYHIEHLNLKEIIGYDLYVAQEGYYQDAHAYANPKYLNTNDFILEPFAWIRVHFKNIDPVDEEDICIFYMSSYTLHNASVGGVNVNESALFKGVGGTPSYLEWYVTKGGIKTMYTDTITVVGHDTTTYLLEF